jgi:hypothetical protein
VGLHVPQVQPATRSLHRKASFKDVGDVRHAVVSEDISHLQTLQAVCTEGSVSDAAKCLQAGEKYAKKACIVEKEQALSALGISLLDGCKRCLAEQEKRPEVKHRRTARCMRVEQKEGAGQGGQCWTDSLDEVRQQGCLLGPRPRYSLHLEAVQHVQTGGLVVNVDRALRAE